MIIKEVEVQTKFGPAVVEIYCSKYMMLKFTKTVKLNGVTYRTYGTRTAVGSKVGPVVHIHQWSDGKLHIGDEFDKQGRRNKNPHYGISMERDDRWDGGVDRGDPSDTAYQTIAEEVTRILAEHSNELLAIGKTQDVRPLQSEIDEAQQEIYDYQKLLREAENTKRSLEYLKERRDQYLNIGKEHV